MTKSQNNTGSAVGVGLVMGGLGVLAGILMAPRSGRDTRKQLATKHSELKGRAKHAANEFKSKSKSMVETGKDKVRSVADEAEVIAEERKEDARSLADQAKESAKKPKEDAERLRQTAQRR